MVASLALIVASLALMVAALALIVDHSLWTKKDTVATTECEKKKKEERLVSNIEYESQKKASMEYWVRTRTNLQYNQNHQEHIVLIVNVHPPKKTSTEYWERKITSFQRSYNQQH